MFGFLFSFSLSYTKSRYGFVGTDTIQIQNHDSLEILGDIPTPTVRFINESGFSNPPIKEDQYPWPGHPYKCTAQQLFDEDTKINRKFCRCHSTFTQEDSFAHPKGVIQFLGDEEALKNATRHKFRFFINTKYGRFHWTSIYAPPGELITIELPKNAIGRVKLHFNRHCDNGIGLRQRIDRLYCSFMLDYGINKFAWPYGGQMHIEAPIDTFNDGLEINITGGVRMPYFRYGATTDKEWEEEISKYPAPLAVFDTGAAVIHMPSTYVRNIKKVNDALAFWRSHSRTAFSVNEVKGFSRGKFGNILHPIEINVDSYVRKGLAYAYAGANFIQAPFSWSNGYINSDSINWGIWGQLHEYDHHYQENWGFGGYVEVTNNVINLITYCLSLETTAVRGNKIDGSYYYIGQAWHRFAHPYFHVNANQHIMLSFWSCYIHYFGTDAFRKALKAHITQSLYKRSEYGYIGELILTFSKSFNRDLRPMFKTYPILFNYDNEITDKVNSMLNDLKLKEFHPVANVYQTGYVIDDKEFETARPFNIPCREPYVFDFVKFTQTRNDLHEFEFVSVEGSKGKMDDLGNGKFRYTPLDDLSVIDKFYVNYQDKTNNEITKCVVSVKQTYIGSKTSYLRVENTITLEQAYDKLQENSDDSTVLITNSLRIVGSRPVWAAVSDSVFYPPKTEEYKFWFATDDKSMFFISEKPFTGNFEADKEYLYARLDRQSRNWVSPSNTKWMNLEKDKKYYMRHVVLNIAGNGKTPGQVGYINKDNDSVKELPTERVRFVNAKLDDVDLNPFMPKIENDPAQGLFGEGKTIKYDQSKFILTEKPTAESGADLSKLLFDYVYANQDTVVYPENFPVNYGVDFGDKIIFDRVNLFVEGCDMTSDVSIACDDKDIYRDSFESHKSNNIDLGKAYQCRKMKLSILSNSRDKCSGITEIQPVLMNSLTSINIIPTTHTKIKPEGDANLSTNGIYFNGKGYHMKKDSSITFNIHLNSSGDSIAILGDRWKYGGSFSVYVDDELHGHVDTSFIHPETMKPLINIEVPEPGTGSVGSVGDLSGQPPSGGYVEENDQSNSRKLHGDDWNDDDKKEEDDDDKKKEGGGEDPYKTPFDPNSMIVPNRDEFRLYHSLLYGIPGLEPNSYHKVKIVCSDGEVGIAGFLANAEIVDKIPKINPKPKKEEDDNKPETGETESKPDESEPESTPNVDGKNTTTTESPENDSKAGLTNGAKIGIGFGAVAVVLIIAAAVFAVIFIMKKNQVLPIEEDDIAEP